MRHIISARQFSRKDLDGIFERTDVMRDRSQEMDDRRRLMGSHAGRVMTALFYEPSTRTRLSFVSAAKRLGMHVIETENAAEFSSASKGETIEDSTRVVAGYSDLIVMRHKENGAAGRAAAVSHVPVINAGDGTGEHPTQALLDLYTIQDKKKTLGGLHVVVGGDLKHGRTARSLTQLLTLYPDNHFSFVSTGDLRMGGDVKDYVLDNGGTFSETDNMYDPLPTADVVYWTRMQTERHGTDVQRGLDFVIGERALSLMMQDAIIMHPLPRVGEIDPAIDGDERAVYFEQAQNGLYVRMALLDMLMPEENTLAA